MLKNSTLPPTSEPLAHTIKEAVALSGLSRTSLYEAIKAGDLTARKFGARTVILRADLQRFLNELTTA